MIKKLKKVFVGVFGFFLGLMNKVYGTMDYDYKAVSSSDYAAPQIPDFSRGRLATAWLNIFRLFLPFVMLIGVLIYLKNSKSDKKRKIITSIVIIGIGVLLVLILTLLINYIGSNM